VVAARHHLPAYNGSGRYEAKVEAAVQQAHVRGSVDPLLGGERWSGEFLVASDGGATSFYRDPEPPMESARKMNSRQNTTREEGRRVGTASPCVASSA